MMKPATCLAAISLVALTACGQAQRSTTEADAQGAAEINQADTYSASGKVTAVAADQVTIAHGPVEEIGWPAMTMTFTAPPGVAEGISAGSDVSFDFRRDGSSYVLTRIEQR